MTPILLLAVTSLCCGSAESPAGPTKPRDSTGWKWKLTVYYTAVERFHTGSAQAVIGCLVLECAKGFVGSCSWRTGSCGIASPHPKVGKHLDLYIGEEDQPDFATRSPKVISTIDATISMFWLEVSRLIHKLF